MREFREIAERLAGAQTRGRVRVWLAGGVVEGVLEFVDGPLWVVADRGARTWIDERAVQAVTLLDAAGVSDAVAEAASAEPPASIGELRARAEALSERFDCNVSVEPPASDDGRRALAQVLVDLETALHRVAAAHGPGLADEGLRVVSGDPGVRREDGALVVSYRAGPRGRLDLDRLVAALERLSVADIG